MPRPDPAQQHRLESITTSLRERTAEADERGRLGEAEALQASLGAAEQKLVHIRRTAPTIGLPILPLPKPRSARGEHQTRVGSARQDIAQQYLTRYPGGTPGISPKR